MRKGTGMAGFLAVTVILVSVAAFFCAETVMCRTRVEDCEFEEYYRTKERELAENVREVLRGEGLDNSGVMITRVVEADGSRQYTVAVHHSGIDAMEEGERELLAEKLESLTFEDDRCSVRHQFF